MRHTLCLLACLIALPREPLFPRTVHVPADSATIQAAILGAQNGDTVMVAPGVYAGHDIDFLGKAIRVTGWDPGDSATVAATIVDGGFSGPVFVFRTGEDTMSVLTGLTITGGSSDRGGGVFCSSASPRIERCTIAGNEAFAGGGIHCLDSDSPIIRDCDIRDNRADYGGGVALLHCPSAIVSGSRIAGNRAEQAGGGVYCNDTPALLTRLAVSGNGGSGIQSRDSAPVISHCVIEGNTGGGIRFRFRGGTVTNTIISGNSANSGGGLYFLDCPAAEVAQCTITGNVAVRGGSAFCDSSAVSFENSILWGNTPSEVFVLEGAAPAVRYSIVSGGWPGEGNLDADPRLVSFRGFSCILHPASPAIDAGDPAALDGVTWPEWYPDGPRADMGAYGGPGASGWLPAGKGD